MIVVWRTVEVLGAGSVNEKTVREIATTEKDVPLDDTILLGGYENVGSFLDNYKIVSKNYVIAEGANDTAAIAGLKDSVARLNYHLDILLLAAKYAMVLKSYKKAIKWLFGCAVAAAVAIGVFAWATGQKTTPLSVFQSPPSAASVTLTASGNKMLKDTLGQQCVEQATIPVILLSIQDGKFEVVTTPSDTCRVARFTITMDIGQVQLKSPQEMAKIAR